MLCRVVMENEKETTIHSILSPLGRFLGSRFQGLGGCESEFERVIWVRILDCVFGASRES